MTCLAVIDMQRVFADPDSSWFTPRFAEVIAPITRLAAGFGPRTVFTRFVAPPSPEGAWADYYERWPFALRPPDADLYRLVDDFTPPSTLDAPTFGKWTPPLAALVGAGGTLVLAGVSTDCCVLSTALAAADAGVRVRVVAEACAGSTDEAHHQALTIMSLYAPLIEVVSLNDLVPAVTQ